MLQGTLQMRQGGANSLGWTDHCQDLVYRGFYFKIDVQVVITGYYHQVVVGFVFVSCFRYK